MKQTQGQMNLNPIADIHAAATGPDVDAIVADVLGGKR